MLVGPGGPVERRTAIILQAVRSGPAPIGPVVGQVALSIIRIWAISAVCEVMMLSARAVAGP
ncbi:hypothetical protein GCM10010518_55250 [Kitasatospora cinereorecta]